MRYIDKTNRHVDFDAFCNEIKKRLKDWNDLKSKRNKAKVRGNGIQMALFQHLWLQQKGLCIYCQQEIIEKKQPYTTPDATIAQIEHICPQSICKDLIFEQNNLVVSCEGFNLSQPTETEKRRNFCGHYKDNSSKGNSYDELLFLNPTTINNVEDYFYYNSSGEITPNPSQSVEKQAQATYMIKTLGLDNPILNAMRKEQYDIFFLNYSSTWENSILDESMLTLPAFHSMLKSKFL